jgi:serine protease AprX
LPRLSARIRRAAFVIALAAGAAVAVRGAPAQHRAQLSDDLVRLQLRDSRDRARIIVRGAPAVVDAIAARHGLPVVQRLAGGAVLLADSSELAALAADRAVAHLSGDAVVAPTMAVSNSATAADQTWAGSQSLLGLMSTPGVTGRGIGVAVVDSGIASHSALKNRVVANVSFVPNDPQVGDPFGHGTHVAGIIAGVAGAALKVTPAYAGGVAPDVHLVNVRVLGADGSGYTSSVIAGIEWAIANRARFNIRVINLSLGHPVMEPAATDPLCQAVARAVAEGIVVVVAGGNAGQTAEGARILGGITSPGNSPFAVTVGSLNTWGTVDRRDDTIADYSSRGPTKYDLAVKPDLVAPGNRIVSLEASRSYLAAAYPWIHIAGSGTNAYMRLSGTSMAAPIVSGAVALLLQGSPGLGTGQVKLALQSGATFIPDGGLIGGGAGSLNIWASRQIAANGLSLPATLIGSLVSPSGASFWDAGTLTARLYSGVGIRLLSALDLARVWSDPRLLRFGDLNLVGVLNPLAQVAPNPLIWGEVAAWAANDEIIWGTNDEIIWGTNDEIIWGTTIHDPEGREVVWGTSGDDEIIWGTNTLTSPEAR